MKRILAALALFLIGAVAHADVIGVSGKLSTLLNGVTTAVSSNSYQFMNARDVPLRAHKVTSTAGTGTATVTVEVNDNISHGWLVACTLNVSNTTPSDSCITNAPWVLMRHTVTAISGLTLSSSISE